jgi:hypothetical protein
MIFDVEPQESADFQEAPKSESACTIPAHVPHILRRGDVAKVLGLKDEHIRYLTRRGKIPLLNQAWRDHCEWREYRPEDIAGFAESRQIVPNWNALNE